MTEIIRLRGKLLKCGDINKNNTVWPVGCNIIIPERVPLIYEMDETQILGYARVKRQTAPDNGADYLLAECNVNLSDIWRNAMLSNIVMAFGGQIPIDGLFTVYEMMTNRSQPTKVLSSRLLAVSITRFPVNYEYYLEPVKKEKKKTMKNDDRDLKRNGEGYSDPTAYHAIKNLDNERDRFDKFIHTLFNICELSGYHIEERIVVKDLKTGKIWK